MYRTARRWMATGTKCSEKATGKGFLQCLPAGRQNCGLVKADHREKYSKYAALCLGVHNRGNALLSGVQ